MSDNPAELEAFPLMLVPEVVAAAVADSEVLLPDVSMPDVLPGLVVVIVAPESMELPYPVVPAVPPAPVPVRVDEHAAISPVSSSAINAFFKFFIALQKFRCKCFIM